MIQTFRHFGTLGKHRLQLRAVLVLEPTVSPGTWGWERVLDLDSNIITTRHCRDGVQSTLAVVTRMHSSRMRTTRFSGHLFCMHPPLPCTPPCHAYPPSCHACPLATHAPSCHACSPSPHMPPPFTMHAPLCHACPLHHACLLNHAHPLCHARPVPFVTHTPQ